VRRGRRSGGGIGTSRRALHLSHRILLPPFRRSGILVGAGVGICGGRIASSFQILWRSWCSSSSERWYRCNLVLRRQYWRLALFLRRW
jgi:hypothetical protein